MAPGVRSGMDRGGGPLQVLPVFRTNRRTSVANLLASDGTLAEDGVGSRSIHERFVTVRRRRTKCTCSRSFRISDCCVASAAKN